METWKAIPGYGRYDVSDLGRVRSRCHSSPRLLKASLSAAGYPVVNLWRSGRVKQKYVHRLVLLSFVGPPGDSQEGAHLNGDPADSRLVNLMWVAHVENMAHTELHGTRARGSRLPQSRLTKDNAQEARRRCAQGQSQQEVARRFGVCQQTISKVITEKTWR